MRIKFYIFTLFFTQALNAYGQEREFEAKKEQITRPEQTKAQKNRPAAAKKNKTGNGKLFIPSEKVSPDIPVSFPADI